MGKWKQRCDIAERQLANAYDFFERAEKRVDTLTGKVSWIVPQTDGKHNAVWTRDKENDRWLMSYEDRKQRWVDVRLVFDKASNDAEAPEVADDE